MWRVLLHDARGKRLYVTAEERVAFLAAAAKEARPVRTSCGVLRHAGMQSIRPLHREAVHFGHPVWCRCQARGSSWLTRWDGPP